MKDQQITKYFSQKTHPIIMILGVALIIVGFCIWWFLYWVGLSMPLILVGVVILILLNMQTKDSEVDALCSKLENDFRKSFEERFENSKNREYVAQNAAPLYTTTYLADGYGILTRCGSDGRIRTSSCQCVGILLGSTEVKFGQQTFSLIGGDTYAPIFSSFAFSELSEVVLRESVSPHTVIMEVCDILGEIVFQAQISNDAESELTVQNINARIRRTKSTRT